MDEEDLDDDMVDAVEAGGGLAQAGMSPITNLGGGMPDWAQGPLAQAKPQPIEPAIIKLEAAGRQVPGNQLIDLFRDHTVGLLPKIEEMERAKQARQAAAQRMSEHTPYMDEGLPWLQMAAGMLKPTRTGSFAESLGYGLDGMNAGLADRQKAMREALARRTEMGYKATADEEQDLLRRQQIGTGGIKALATIEALNARLGRPGAMSDLEKRVRAMGLDPLTPQGRRMMLRLNYMQNGTPEIKSVVGAYPDLDPEGPEFAKLVQAAMDQKSDTVTSRIEGADAAARLADARRLAAEQALADAQKQGKKLGPDPELATQLGVPVSNVNPYANLSGKAAETYFQNQEKEWSKELEGLNERMAKASLFEGGANRILELLPQVGKTGGMYKIPGMTWVGTAVSPAVAEFEAKAKEMAPNLRVAGSGAMSDFDVKILLSSTVGLDKPQETNKNIALGYIAAARRMAEHRSFKEKYFSANGHVKGFEDAWRSYTKEEPILETNSKADELHIRKKIKTFSEWAKDKGMIK